MTPDLQMSVLCDDVRQEQNGKFILVGLFDVVGMAEVPGVFPRICVVNRWCSGQGEFQETTRIVVAEDGQPVVETKAIPVRLQNPEATATNIAWLMNVRFTRAGVHWVEILLDGDMKLRYPLRVNRIQSGRTAPA